MMVKQLSIISIFVAALACLPVNAQEKEDLPSDDFLEYLATLVEEEGEWVDPLELDELPDDHIDFKAASEEYLDDTQHAEEKP